jgi:carbonic anhydrase/acetyltransferase-like protein (isoleucine patch superfamily)
MSAEPKAPGLGTALRDYLSAEHGGARGWARDALLAAAESAPGLPGIVLRSVWDRCWVAGDGRFVRERGVRILGAQYLTLDDGVYLDRGVYLHGRPGGLAIGAGTRVMAGAVVHGYNFRGLPHSGIKIGRHCVIGFNCVITGQGGVSIGDDVIMAPGAMVLPVDHVYDDPERPIREQGIVGQGIIVGPGAWIGAGALILDGVTVGANAVVAAGAVVTRDVAERTVVAGNPARPVVRTEGATE